jgi:hypothetical protein
VKWFTEEPLSCGLAGERAYGRGARYNESESILDTE